MVPFVLYYCEGAPSHLSYSLPHQSTSHPHPDAPGYGRWWLVFLPPQHVRRGRIGRGGEFVEYAVVRLVLAEILTTAAECVALQGGVFVIVVIRVGIHRQFRGVQPSRRHCSHHYLGGRHGKSCSREGRGILRHSSPFARSSEQCLPHLLASLSIVE